MSKILSSYFEKDAIVDIIAPASLCSVFEIKQSIEYVKQLGLKPRFNKNLLKQTKTTLLSQSLLQKKRELQNALESSDSNIIWCLRGGYGSFKLLPFLSKLKRPKHKKLLIGYSDITALHYLFNQKWKQPSLHFSGVEELSTFFYKNHKHKPGYLKFLGLRQGKNIEYKKLSILGLGRVASLVNLGFCKTRSANTYHLNSVLVGGNLCTLVSLLGSKTLHVSKITKPSFKSILFLEDLNEPPYKVDRMLYQLKESGYFKNIKAIALGDFISKYSDRKKIKKIFKELSESLSIPVVWGLSVGHGKTNDPLPLMLPVNLSIKVGSDSKKSFAKLSYL